MPFPSAPSLGRFKSIYIRIDEATFRELVNGRIAKQRVPPGLNGQIAEILLEDIGFRRMHEIILEAAVLAGVKE